MNATASLALATVAFVGTHFAMSHPLRAGLVARIGEKGFAGLYSLIAFLTLGWMIFAWRSIDD
ncbi:MAG: NnrU family protein, partial [Pseudomonadota bacterium]|nr:NnrU family protein [Pseudomonadota bacterium]